MSDYRVLILAVDEEYVARVDLERFRSEDSTINLDDASKLLGCWRGLSKIKTQGEDVDHIPMKRAVAFANTIDASQVLAKRLEIVGRTANRPAEGNQGLSLQSKHVDGKQNALVRRQSLEWLKAYPGQQTARILTNARCLSEGIDVPALDAVIFTEARGSQVDIVQAVGRVMRKYEGKNSGYIILPVAITAGADVNSTLKGTKYKVIWDVLNALRAHDDRFDVIINQINLNHDRDSKIEVEVVTGDSDEEISTAEDFEQGILVHLPSQIADGVYAKIVEKVGDRQYWEKWAKDIAEIASSQEKRIKALIAKPKSKAGIEFSKFLTAIRNNLNDSISSDDAVEMLAQHLITKPIFNALFGEYKFASRNPVSQTMDGILESLEDHVEQDAKLNQFYESVTRKVESIDNNASRQKLIVELYEKFFKTAFPKMTEKLGIVYTPIETVDFIIHSIEQVLSKDFDTSLGNMGVQILDPFTGTGTFITRLLQSGLISKGGLKEKYLHEIHANEIVLLAYYIAAINIESTFHDLLGDDYLPFEGVVLTDTFQMYEDDDKIDDQVFVQNNSRVENQKLNPIRVIFGNPPYSVGQENQNDNNQNVAYPSLDNKIRLSYAANSAATNLNALYDSYIRSFRWASDRIGDSGIIGFVTNGSFIDGKAMDGFRKTLSAEFSSIYILNLRGNARTQGDLRRREGGNIFGEGSRTPVAITILVKKSGNTSPCEVKYFEAADFLDREAKLRILGNGKSISDIPFNDIRIDGYGDWINQRDESYERYELIAAKGMLSGSSIFTIFTGGIKTAKDAWVFNFDKQQLSSNIQGMINYFNKLIDEYKSNEGSSGAKNDIALKKFIEARSDSTKISWDRSLIADVGKGKKIVFDADAIRMSLYRPYSKKYLYFDSRLNEMMYQTRRLFPDSTSPNRLIVVNNNPLRPFSALMTDCIPESQLLSNDQCFPLYVYNSESSNQDLFSESESGRSFAISQTTLERYRKKFGQSVSEENIFYYVYGLLNHPDYVRKYKNELGKGLPRIPMVSAFHELSDLGSTLGELHINYEKASGYFPTGLEEFKKERIAVERIRFDKVNGVSDKTRLIINSSVLISDIPAEADQYQLSGRSALEWIVDRYEIKTDKGSGIVQDPNAFSSVTTYVTDLIAQVIEVSIKHVDLVSKAPKYS